MNMIRLLFIAIACLSPLYIRKTYDRNLFKRISSHTAHTMP